MKHVKWMVVGVLALCVSGVVLHAADEPKPADSSDKTTKTDSKDEKKPMSTGGRLVMPYSKMTSLSDDQKGKIISIHKDYNAQRKELDKKEHDEIMALLSDDQKKEAEKIEGEKKTTGTKKSDAKSSDAKTSDAASGDKKE